MFILMGEKGTYNARNKFYLWTVACKQMAANG